MPFPSTTTIPPGWSDAHRGVAESSMTATVKVFRVDSDSKNDRAAFDPKRVRAAGAPKSDAAASDSTLIYEGPASVIAQTSQAATADVAKQNITVRTYAISLPRSAPRPRAGEDGSGDRVVVTAAPGDPDLVGRFFRVIDVAVSSESFARDVIAIFDVSANNPPRATPGGTP